MFRGVIVDDKKPAVLMEQNTSYPIKCFGEFEVRNAKGHSVHWPTRKTEELFAFFLCCPQSEIAGKTLVKKLWPEIDADRAAHLLQRTIQRLSVMLEEHELGMDIQETERGYRLAARENLCDVRVFAHYGLGHDKDWNMERTEQMCFLYRGRLLENKTYSWKAHLEEHYHDLYTHLTRMLVRHRMGEREWHQAERHLVNFLYMEPLHEEMNISLLLIYAHMGNAGKLAKHYTWLETVLHNVGIEPPASLQKWVASYLA